MRGIADIVTRWTRQNFELVHINEPVQNFGPPSRNFGPPKTELAWQEWRKMLGRNVAPAPNRSANYTKNMLATCSLMYVQSVFIAYNIKKCFWLQFNRSEPCWSSSCIRNRQGSGTKYPLRRCKHGIKILPTSGRFQDDSGTFLAHKI